MTDTEIQQFQTDKQRKLNQADHGRDTGGRERIQMFQHIQMILDDFSLTYFLEECCRFPDICICFPTAADKNAKG